MKRSPFFGSSRSSSSTASTTQTTEAKECKLPSSTCPTAPERKKQKRSPFFVKESKSTARVSYHKMTFEEILHQFQLSHKKMSNDFIKGGTDEKADNESICPICLLSNEEDVRGVPNGCSHNDFCFTCLSAWGRVVNKCPLCKAQFTEVYCQGNPSVMETFSTMQECAIDQDDSGPTEELEELIESEQFNEVAPSCFGYDDDDGFIVADDVVEYVEADENDGLLDI